MKSITKDIYYVGVNDYDLDLFEGQYPVEHGMAYNSYIIKDGKTAVLDSVDRNFGDEWLKNVKETLNGIIPDYLIVSHMEPDHSSNIFKFIEEYPDVTVVLTAKAKVMLNQFFHKLPKNILEVKDNDTLSLGEHTLKFITAPMVHWPEVMFTYDEKDKVLFSADAFGKFGTLDYDDPEGWACEARRYYFGIVGKYGMQVQAVLKKLSNIEIKIICSLHGPVLDKELDYYLNLYNIWSSYLSETKGVFIAYSSIYGNTEKVCLKLKEMLDKEGIKTSVADLNRDMMSEAVEDAFRYDRIVLASSTYNADIFPSMKTFIDALVERNFQNKKVGIIENGSWAPMAARVITSKLEGLKNIEILEPKVKVISTLDDKSLEELKALKNALI